MKHVFGGWLILLVFWLLCVGINSLIPGSKPGANFLMFFGALCFAFTAALLCLSDNPFGE